MLRSRPKEEEKHEVLGFDAHTPTKRLSIT
jgi:hypothetical protein